MRKYKLNELGTVSRGKSKHRPRNDPQLFGGQYPFLQTGDVKHAPLYVNSHSQTYNEKGLEQSKLWPAGTLCITIAANIADTAILSYPACFPDSVIGFNPYEGVADTKYVKYCLDTFQLQMRSISQGTTQDNMSLEKLLSMGFPVPQIEQQRKVAAILTTYDDLIENNKSRITLLQNMAEEIYREWFVRFRFPGWQEAEFEKGLPVYWQTSGLGQIAKFIMGQSPKSEFYNRNGDGLPFHQGVGTFGKRFPKNEVYCSVTGREAKANDILFSVRAPVGRLNIALEHMVIGRGLAAVRHHRGCQSYLFYLLSTAFRNEDIIGNGAIFNAVGKDELLSFKVLSPPDELVDAFEKLVKPIDEQIAGLIEQNEVLEKTKNQLLPRLISGELSVENLDIQFPPSMQSDQPGSGDEAAA